MGGLSRDHHGVTTRPHDDRAARRTRWSAPRANAPPGPDKHPPLHDPARSRAPHETSTETSTNEGCIAFWEYLNDPFVREDLLEQAIGHIKISLIPILVATILGIGLGIAAQRNSVLRPAILNTTSVFLTIPSFALFGLMIPIFGIGDVPVMVALTMYALLAIVRNTVSGLNSVDPAVVESARGMGLSNRQRLTQIEMPIAWPVIIAGVRVSAQLVIGVASVAVLVGGSGLGEEIYQNGLRNIGSAGAFESVLGGTLAILILAFLFDLILQTIERLTTSKGIA